MRPVLPSFSWFRLVQAVAAGLMAHGTMGPWPAFGADPVVQNAVPGLGVTLNTSGFALAQPQPGTAGRPSSLMATLIVTNRSRIPVRYIFNSEAGRAERVGFKVFDAGGRVLWQSLP